MRRSAIAVRLIALLALLAPMAAGGKVNYNWVQVGYATTDLDRERDYEGIDIRASTWLQKYIFSTGMYRHQTAPVSWKSRPRHREDAYWAVGFRYPFAQDADIYLAPSLEYADETWHESDQEVGLRLGFRQRFNRLEVHLEARRVPTGGEDELIDGYTATTAGFQLHLAPGVGAVIELDNSSQGANDHMRTWTLGLRANY